MKAGCLREQVNPTHYEVTGKIREQILAPPRRVALFHPDRDWLRFCTLGHLMLKEDAAKTIASKERGEERNVVELSSAQKINYRPKQGQAEQVFAVRL